MNNPQFPMFQLVSGSGDPVQGGTAFYLVPVDQATNVQNAPIVQLSQAPKTKITSLNQLQSPGQSRQQPTSSSQLTNNSQKINGTSQTNNGTSQTNNGTSQTNNGTSQTNNGTSQTTNGSSQTTNGTQGNNGVSKPVSQQPRPISTQTTSQQPRPLSPPQPRVVSQLQPRPASPQPAPVPSQLPQATISSQPILLSPEQTGTSSYAMVIPYAEIGVSSGLPPNAIPAVIIPASAPSSSRINIPNTPINSFGSNTLVPKIPSINPVVPSINPVVPKLPSVITNTPFNSPIMPNRGVPINSQAQFI